MKKLLLLLTTLCFLSCSTKPEKLKIMETKKSLNKDSKIVTVIVNVSYSEEVTKVKDFIKKEQVPLFFNLEDSGIVRFEWFLNEEENSGTLIEVFENANAFQTLGSKVLGSPINIKFNELFSIESLTVLGQIPDDFKSKLKPMNPDFKLYSGGIN
jgi:hypothetical protein